MGLNSTVLLLSFDYYPKQTPRSFRWTTLAEHWAAQGHRVHVISGWAPPLPRYEVCSGVTVHRVGGAFLEWMRRLAGGSMSFAGGPVPLTSRRRPSLLKRIHDITWKRVYWPDYACMWYLPALATAERLLSQLKVNGLITVSHPFTAHLVGSRLKVRHPDLPWLADVGDPFCFLSDLPPNNMSIYQSLNRLAEGKVFGMCDSVALTAENTLERYAELFPSSAGKMHIIPPVLSLPNLGTAERLAGPGKKRRLLFAGTLYRSIRNPQFLLRLFAELLQSSPLKGTLELHFYGLVSDCATDFEPYEDLMGRSIFLHGQVSRAELHQAMLEADVLVNLANATRYQLPSKVVEYVSTGKPILNISKIEDDSSTVFFRSYPAALALRCYGESPTPQQVGAVIDFVERSPKVDERQLSAYIAGFSTEVIAQRYMNLLFGGRTDG